MDSLLLDGELDTLGSLLLDGGVLGVDGDTLGAGVEPVALGGGMGVELDRGVNAEPGDTKESEGRCAPPTVEKLCLLVKRSSLVELG
jgi:hypothetical protein